MQCYLTTFLYALHNKQQRYFRVGKLFEYCNYFTSLNIAFVVNNVGVFLLRI